MAAKRGAFIVFEGIDRCGKTTQSQKLVEYLHSQNVPVEHWRFPDRTTASGQIINQYLAKEVEMEDESIHLLFSLNRWEKRRALLDKLRSGVTLIVDRYAYSGIAYSAAKQKGTMPLQWCKAPDTNLPAPDAVIYMQLTPEASAKRGGYGGERYEKQAFQETVANMYDALRDSRWLVIDADQPVDSIHEQIKTEVKRVMQTVTDGAPLCRLWDNQPEPDDPNSS